MNMRSKIFGKIVKVTGVKVTIAVLIKSVINKVSVDNFELSYVSIGSLVGTKLVDGRTLVLTVEEVYDNKGDILITSFINGIYDNVLCEFTFGINAYPLIGEHVYTLDNDILSKIFAPKKSACSATIGTYIYDSNVLVGYNPNVLFGKHLGVFGNTGSGKTCTVVSIIQNYIRNNQDKNIKFIILDVNGEYETAFNDEEADYYTFDSLRFHHTILNNAEYGRLFRASEGIQYPALKDSINDLSNKNKHWDLIKLTDSLQYWIDNIAKNDNSRNQLNGYLRTMVLRIESIINDDALMTVINSSDDGSTLNNIITSNKKIHILDLQVSSDSLDIVLYLLFKTIYLYKTRNRNTHLNLVLEEAHRYINFNVEETKLGNYYIDKLSREGRKFGIGLIISSQVPSMLSYEIVSQCNSVIMHKITNKRDLEFLRG